jgi:putative DNA-invertase from lambdoid prophage Rac
MPGKPAEFTLPALPPAQARNAMRALPPTGRCFGYARVSTTMQAEEGESLDVQQRVIAGYATMHGMKVGKVFVERGVSGSKPLGERPEGGTLLATPKPGDVVITPKLDRMFRSALDPLDVMGAMKKTGISLHMIDLGGDTTGNDVSKLMFTILAAVAEGDCTRERVAEVKRDQKNRGRYLGGIVPFGYTLGDDGKLVPVPAQQKAIARMRKLREQGLKLRAIAAKMTAAGHPISHVGVRNILASERGAA